MAADLPAFAALAARLDPSSPSRAAVGRLCRLARAAPELYTAEVVQAPPALGVFAAGGWVSLLEVLARLAPRRAGKAVRAGAPVLGLPRRGAELLRALDSSFHWKGRGWQEDALRFCLRLEAAGVDLDATWPVHPGLPEASLLSHAAARGTRLLVCFLLPRSALRGAYRIRDYAVDRLFEEERARRRRWSPLRAAWAAAAARSPPKPYSAR